VLLISNNIIKGFTSLSQKKGINLICFLVVHYTVISVGETHEKLVVYNSWQSTLCIAVVELWIAYNVKYSSTFYTYMLVKLALYTVLLKGW
jgi:hypothetical protein